MVSSARLLCPRAEPPLADSGRRWARSRVRRPAPQRPTAPLGRRPRAARSPRRPQCPLGRAGRRSDRRPSPTSCAPPRRRRRGRRPPRPRPTRAARRSSPTGRARVAPSSILIRHPTAGPPAAAPVSPSGLHALGAHLGDHPATARAHHHGVPVRLAAHEFRVAAHGVAHPAQIGPLARRPTGPRAWPPPPPAERTTGTPHPSVPSHRSGRSTPRRSSITLGDGPLHRVVATLVPRPAAHRDDVPRAACRRACPSTGCATRSARRPDLVEQTAGARARGPMGPAHEVGLTSLPPRARRPADQVDVPRLAAVAGADDGQLLGSDRRRRRRHRSRPGRAPGTAWPPTAAARASTGSPTQPSKVPSTAAVTTTPRCTDSTCRPRVTVARGSARPSQSAAATGQDAPAGGDRSAGSTPAGGRRRSRGRRIRRASARPEPESPAHASSAETPCRDPASSSAQASRCMAISWPATARSSTG